MTSKSADVVADLHEKCCRLLLMLPLDYLRHCLSGANNVDLMRTSFADHEQQLTFQR